MNIIDIVLLIFLLWAIYEGWKKGLIFQVLNLLGLVIGIWASYSFTTTFVNYAKNYIVLDESFLSLLAFIIIFIVINFFCYIIAKILTKIIKILLLGWLNTLLGILVSLCKYLIIIGLVVLLIESINNQFQLIDATYLHESVLYNFLNKTIKILFPYLKNLVN